MDDLHDTTLGMPASPIRCEVCGFYYDPQTGECPYCHPAPAVIEADTTGKLDRTPSAVVASRIGNTHLDPQASVIVQFFPSGTCFVLPLDRPVILGRGTSSTPQEFVDLTCLEATQHGVSRLHCLLQRQSDQLAVCDLGSTNGTHLNGERLPPHEMRLIAHGDRLILGTLHLSIWFTDMPGETSSVQDDQPASP